MDLVPEPLEDTLTELQIVNSTECLHQVLDAQRALFHSQIDQLQRIVVTQCKLTGVNPLSQEMAAGALSIKIGKKPRDLLNPKAIKYMQSIFSIKDTVSKKDTREISALCGVTITQVREFFASQRSRVRKLVRLSREKAIKSNASTAITTGSSSDVDHATPVSSQTCDNTTHPKNVEECKQVSVDSVEPLDAVQQSNQTSKDHMDVNSLTENLSCSIKEENIPGIDSTEQSFVESIFNLMRKEETFSGQVKLMDWILQIHNLAVLQWFLTKGGVMILATWLSQAALEEQTTVLLIIFKVLCHLPLHKALPAQMSAILQTVNKLRSDISNKARVLLSRWSKMFVRSQALKRPFAMNYPNDTHKEIVRKQRISEILSDESWLSKVDLPEDVLALAFEDSEDNRKGDSKSALKLLPATCNDSSKKQARSIETKERRKVLLVEQPDHKPAGRSGQTVRAVPAKSSRPMSADDIQKAKMRAIFMQRKYGNTDTPANENCFQKAINQKITVTSQANGKLLSKLPKVERDEDNKLAASATESSESMQKVFIDSKPSLSSGELKASLASDDPKPCLISEESLSEKVKNGHVTWQMPAVMKLNSMWSVGSGENSKDMEVQTARIRREKETFYLTADDIPANPKDPWDVEMDFDDSLTPEIPTEPPPDAEVADGETSTRPDVGKDTAEDNGQPATTSAPVTAGAPPEPDLELLAVLLKNPDVVFALTSGQGTSLTNAETVALLDVLKRSSGGLPGMLLNGSAAAAAAASQASEPPTSLPSPTPPSERTRMGWQSESGIVVKNPPQLQHDLPGIGIAAVPPVAVAVRPNASPSPAPLLVTPPLRSAVPPLQLPEISLPSPSRLPVAQFHQPITSPSLPHSAPPPISVAQRFHRPEVVPSSKHRPPLDAAVSPMVHQETFSLDRIHSSHKPPTVTAGSSIPPLLPTPPRAQPQPPPVQEPPRVLPRWSSGATAGSGSKELALDSWHGRLNGLQETPAQNPRYSNHQSGANMYMAVPGRVHSNDLLDRSELEPWSPERSPSRGPEYPTSSRSFGDRRGGGDYGRGDRSRQYQHGAGGHRDRHRSGRRWRDRDRRP
ncbi:hypothetical protein Taro_004284 [Colocasia esculenta]|uniref:Homeobox domain-containing protein n=1 Tax=Colocasia esculenta TaxID=4460 RepID=A0A843TUF4_COLES|nr:hypothetical protein [Colocasia esculenta]